MLSEGTSWTGNDKPTPFDYKKAMEEALKHNVPRIPSAFRVNSVGVELLKAVFASPHFPVPAGVPYAIHGMRVKLDPFVPDWVCETLDQRGKLLEVAHLYAGCSVKVGGEYLS